MRHRRFVVLLAVAFALRPALATAQPRIEQPFFTARYDPAFRFRTISVARFDIHFHQGEEALARRLARIVDEVSRDIDARLGAPAGRVQVILVDQSDQSNGWATVLPYNVIELAAAPPRPESVIGNTDDWLRMVFAHEYTHVVHLEKSGGWLGSLRHVFGRLPLFYSNVFLPQWEIEGIATYHESALTAAGRVRAPDFRMLLDRAAAAGRFASLDRASSAVVDWPSGHRPYLYGAYFHQYLVDRFGEAALRTLADETAARLPFFGSRAFRSVYGASLGSLWDAFRADASRSAGAATKATRLTHHGFAVMSPAIARDGRIFYSVSNPHGFPALMQISSGGGDPRQLTTRFRGNRLAVAGDLLVFDQLEVVHQVEAQSDLYAVPMKGGATRQLTHHTRAADPDVSSDGRTIVCTVQQTGRRAVATMPLPAPGALAIPQTLVSQPDAEFSSPRWSPDGRSILAERRTLGGPSEIVVIDVASRAVRPVVSSAHARNASPMWIDAQRILFSSDRDGPFTLFSADITTGRIRKLAGAGPAQSAVMSADAATLVFVGYSADGYDLYSMPLEGAEWIDVAASTAGAVPGAPAIAPSIADRPYAPWATLVPRAWTPVIETADDDVLVGAATAGFDALGRHGYAIVGAWSIDRQRPEWQADYTYARWWPALFASMSDDTDALPSGEVRSRELNTGALFPVRRVRWEATSLAALHLADVRIDDERGSRMRTRSALRGGWGFSSAKSFGYSISAEEGASLRAAVELSRTALGADADASAFIIDARAYVRAFRRHGVVAARVAAAASTGDERTRRTFSAGGAGPQGGGFDFGVDAIALLRGFEASDLAGDRAAVINLDYRFPIAWPQRGAGTLPVLLRAIHGAVFADAGHAWTERFRASQMRRAIGAELSFDIVFGDALPLTFTGGVAWRIDPADEHRGAAAFGRIGRAF
jgi:WD40 repeat protein